jgi:C4-dicarboxylate transporter, DctM subunit
MGTLTALALIVAMFVILGAGVWIGIAVLGVAWLGMELFTTRPGGDALALTVWGSLSSWTLTALPLFIWMGEILLKSRLSEGMFRGLAPWLQWLPGRLLHTNIIGCTIFAAVSGSSAATCATVGKITLPELKKRGYPEQISIGSLAGAGTLGLLIPPSIIMIVYGVAADVSIGKLFIGGVIPGLMLAALFMGYTIVWALRHRDAIPPADIRLNFRQKLAESRHLIPVVLLIAVVLGSIYAGIATATEAAALGVVGALILSAVQRTLTWANFRDALMAATKLYCMIALILAGSAFLSLSMVFFIVLGCFLDGISMVVLTMAVLLPTLQVAQIDLLWFGIFIVIVVEMAQVTPPVGFNLFVLQGMTKHQINTIAVAAFPYFLMMVIAVLLIWFFPQLVTYLPAQMKL